MGKHNRTTCLLRPTMKAYSKDVAICDTAFQFDMTVNGIVNDNHKEA